MVMPTWLLGRRSVSMESESATDFGGLDTPPNSTGGPSSDQQPGGGRGGFGDGHGDGLGLASTGPPGSGGTTNGEALGVGLGGLSPGSLAMLVASARYQLLFGPATTPGGGVYQRLPGMPASALEMNEWTPGDATKTPSEPPIIVYWLPRMSPTHRPTATSGVN